MPRAEKILFLANRKISYCFLFLFCLAAFAKCYKTILCEIHVSMVYMFVHSIALGRFFLPLLNYILTVSWNILSSDALVKFMPTCRMYTTGLLTGCRKKKENCAGFGRQIVR